jgi:hypothetical protein
LLVVCLLSGVAWAGWVTQESGTTQDLNAAYFVSDTLGFIAGNNGTILKTTDGGLTWLSRSTGTANHNDVIFPAATEGYVLGSGGTLLKSVDQGETFTAITLPAAVATGTLRKAAALGDVRALAISSGATTDSYVLISANAGATWTPTALTGLNVAGVQLASDGAGSYNTYVWGTVFGGADTGRNVIRKDGVTVYSNVTSEVSDLVMVSPLVGYAAGSNGLFLKTTTGGAGGSWTTLDCGVTRNLNALAFITDQFGWAVGNGGWIAFTADGGTTFSAYTLDDTTVDIHDTYARLALAGSGVSAAAIKAKAVTALVHTFLATTGGKIFKLASPTITGSSPLNKRRGWVGTVEVTGSGFIPGADISFSRSGTTDVDSDIAVFTVSVESSSKCVATIHISSEATPGLRDLLLTNPDATASREVDAFTIASGEALVSFSDIWLDGSKYLPPTAETPGIPRITINQQPLVTFEVHSTDGLTPAALNCRLITKYGDRYIFSYVPLTALTALGTMDIAVSYQVPEVLPKGVIVDFMLYAEDLMGNATLYPMIVAVAQPAEEGDPSWHPTPPGGSIGDGGGVFLPERNYDRETMTSLPAMIVLKPGISINNFSFNIFDYKGSVVYRKKFINGVGAAAVKSEKVTAKGIVTKFNFNINSAELPPYLSSGVYLVVVRNDNDGKAKNKIVIAPRSMAR